MRVIFTQLSQKLDEIKEQKSVGRNNRPQRNKNIKAFHYILNKLTG